MPGMRAWSGAGDSEAFACTRMHVQKRCGALCCDTSTRFVSMGKGSGCNAPSGSAPEYTSLLACVQAVDGVACRAVASRKGGLVEHIFRAYAQLWDEALMVRTGLG